MNRGGLYYRNGTEYMSNSANLIPVRKLSPLTLSQTTDIEGEPACSLWPLSPTLSTSYTRLLQWTTFKIHCYFNHCLMPHAPPNIGRNDISFWDNDYQPYSGASLEEWLTSQFIAWKEDRFIRSPPHGGEHDAMTEHPVTPQYVSLPWISGFYLEYSTLVKYTLMYNALAGKSHSNILSRQLIQ